MEIGISNLLFYAGLIILVSIAIIKKLGWALIIAGFLWLLIGIELQEPRIRGVIIGSHLSLPQKDSFSKEEVETFIMKACYDTAKSEPNILEPSLMMLLGSIIISRNKRIKNNNK